LKSVLGLRFHLHAFFRFTAGQEAPLAHDVKQLKSVVEAIAVEGPA
jgi:hypothetical protein